MRTIAGPDGSRFASPPGRVYCLLQQRPRQASLRCSNARGPFYARSPVWSPMEREVRRKSWLNLDQQVDLLVERGLQVDDPAACRSTLRRVGYYHLSGYARFFQVGPAHGDNRFQEGATFETIAELQALDSQLRSLCMSALSSVELAVRAGFAHRFGEHVGAYEKLLNPPSFHSMGATSRSLCDLIVEDLDRSKQPFVMRHRGEDGSYPSLPVWVAVEAMSFGTLSKAIEYCATAEIAHVLADDLTLRRVGFSSQVRSFVALRNACAHMSRLWNDVAKNPPVLANNITRRAKTAAGNFDAHGYYHCLVALDLFAKAIDPGSTLLADVDALTSTNDTFRRGLLNPQPY
jgi:abortive infection bacteriophage resistance protein